LNREEASCASASEEGKKKEMALAGRMPDEVRSGREGLMMQAASDEAKGEGTGVSSGDNERCPSAQVDNRRQIV
jgi:hypothetical protein